MSKGTEKDQAGHVGNGAASGAGAPADPVWPVWGGTSNVDPEQDETPAVPEPDVDGEVPADAEPEPTPDPEPDTAEAEAEVVDTAAVEPEPESEVVDEGREVVGESEVVDEVGDAPAEPEPDVVDEVGDAAAESEPESSDTAEPDDATEPDPEISAVDEAEDAESDPDVSEVDDAGDAAAESEPESDVVDEVVVEPELAVVDGVAAEPGLVVDEAGEQLVEPEPAAADSDPIDETDPEPVAVSEDSDEAEPSEVDTDIDDATEQPGDEAASEATSSATESTVAAAESASDPDLEPELESQPEGEPEPDSEPEREPAPEPKLQSEPDAEPEPEAEPADATESAADADETEVLPAVVAAAVASAAVAPPVEPTLPPAPPIASPAQGAPPVVERTPPSEPEPTAVLPPVEAPAPAAATGFAPVTPAAAAPSSTIQAGRVPSSEREPSPFDVFAREDRRRRWPRRLLIVGGIVLVLCAAYVVASFATGDTVPRGASVAGVDIGGLKSAEAVARLDKELADDTTQPIPVVAKDVQATLDPKAAGLTFDAQATVDELTGVNLAEPKRLWDHIVGIGEKNPVTAVDQKKLAAAIDSLGSSLQLLPVDGTIVYVDSTAQSTDAVDGWDLDQVGSAKVVTRDWLDAPRPLQLPTTTTSPAITQEKTAAALTEAAKVTSAPVSVMADGQVALLDAKTLAANSSYVPTDGNLVLQMNGDGLTAAVLAQLPGLLTASADAHFEFQNDAPVIVPGTPGTTLDPKAVAAAVSTAAVANNRSATVDLTQADPAQSTAALEALGIKEIVSEFDTPLTSEPRRTVNITNGASKINGHLVKPGETFSLTEALGPIDAAHGFVEAGAIVSGEHTDAWGGGLSQVSTTSYNAGFLAGFEDITHQPHSEWFARYPEGRESTIFTGVIDMKWKNNTPYGALVQAWVADNRVYVRIWGTKYWSVESITSPRSGVVQPTTVYSQSPTCEASAAGNPGFTVTVTRKTSLNGELKKTESNTWRYKPQNKIICGPAPAPAPTP